MDNSKIAAWVVGRIPDDWFVETPEVRVDREEIQVIGRLPQPSLPEGSDDEDRATADRSRIESWREETRKARIAIARQAEATLGRTISWGARCGDQSAMFTTLSVPVMTRLRMRERQVLELIGPGGPLAVGGARLVREARRRQRGGMAP